MIYLIEWDCFIWTSLFSPSCSTHPPSLFHAILSRILANFLFWGMEMEGKMATQGVTIQLTCIRINVVINWQIRLTKVSFNYVKLDWNWLPGSKTVLGQRERDWQSNHKSKIILWKQGNKSAQVWLRSMCCLKSSFASAQQKQIFHQIAF